MKVQWLLWIIKNCSIYFVETLQFQGSKYSCFYLKHHLKFRASPFTFDLTYYEIWFPYKTVSSAHTLIYAIKVILLMQMLRREILENKIWMKLHLKPDLNWLRWNLIQMQQMQMQILKKNAKNKNIQLYPFLFKLQVCFRLILC
jgi:hypothetical protein